MGRSKKTRAEQDAAMERLCGLVEYGHLMAATRPHDLLNAVCDMVEADRRIIEAARKALDLLDIALGDSDLFDADDESPVAQAFQVLRDALEAADKENE